MSRGSDPFQEVGVRIGAVAFVALVAGVARLGTADSRGRGTRVGGLYAAELAIADAPLDVAVPAVAGLLLCTELGYWSLEERTRWLGERGESLRRPRSSRCSARPRSSSRRLSSRSWTRCAHEASRST